MCIPSLLGSKQNTTQIPTPADPTKQPRPEDVPLGSGLANKAELSLLTRQERLEKLMAEGGA